MGSKTLQEKKKRKGLENIPTTNSRNRKVKGQNNRRNEETDINCDT